MGAKHLRRRFGGVFQHPPIVNDPVQLRTWASQPGRYNLGATTWVLQPGRRNLGVTT